ncbi:MAG: hypothetical protein ABI629_14475 [bacterium]
MSEQLADLQRIGLKLFCADGAAVQPHEFVPIFHHWIQQHSVEQMLIDVANYEHVPDGPGIVLVAHEGNYSIDLGGGQLGIMYTRKAPVQGDMVARLTSLARTVFGAARLLEQDAALGGRLRFRGDRLALFANDRLRAPNDAPTYAAFQPTLDALLHKLYGDAKCEVARPGDPRSRFGVSITASIPASVDELLARLA